MFLCPQIPQTLGLFFPIQNNQSFSSGEAVMDFGRKRGRQDAAFSGGDVGFKKSKDEFDSFTIGVGSKSKPCTKFFSTAGCSFGSSCHFQHYFPGYSAHIQLANNSGGNPASISTARNSSFTDNLSLSFKTRICNKINTPEGCRYGEKCRFAHSETEITNKPRNPIYEDSQRMTGPVDEFSQRFEPAQHGLPVGSFGLSATAKISVDASFAGAIIGKNGINSKQICRETGVRFSIKDHDTDSSKKNIELEGSFDQIKEASSMVSELIVNITAATGGAAQNNGSLGRGGSQSNYYKKKMCEKFTMGLCTFGERCHFAHSANELRNQFT